MPRQIGLVLISALIYLLKIHEPVYSVENNIGRQTRALVPSIPFHPHETSEAKKYAEKGTFLCDEGDLKSEGQVGNNPREKLCFRSVCNQNTTYSCVRDGGS